jgi:pyridoxamine 5'-phosphate oxidase
VRGQNDPVHLRHEQLAAGLTDHVGTVSERQPAVLQRSDTGRQRLRARSGLNGSLRLLPCPTGGGRVCLDEDAHGERLHPHHHLPESLNLGAGLVGVRQNLRNVRRLGGEPFRLQECVLHAVRDSVSLILGQQPPLHEPFQRADKMPELDVALTGRMNQIGQGTVNVLRRLHSLVRLPPVLHYRIVRTCLRVLVAAPRVENTEYRVGHGPQPVRLILQRRSSVPGLIGEVKLKGFDERGFVFYTNLESRKAAELAANPSAALCFFWQPLALQVRIEGPVQRVSDDEADAYYASRPLGSRIGAWASSQSRPLGSYAELMARVQEYEARFAEGEVPRPAHWSGFRVSPLRIEFWEGRASRLHERERFDHDGDGWRVQYLFP